MVLFKEDWLRFPNAIIDTKTRNRSFVDLALKFKAMGVENNAFILALHNPRLQGVDPYSKQLTADQMFMIGVECRQNPWYVLREIFRAPAITGTESVPITANRSIISLWWCFLNHITFILTQPRQTGKSFGTDLLMTMLMNFYCNNTQINLLTKDDILRAANIKRLKEIYEELPVYLNFKTKGDANNTESVTVNRWNNIYLTHVPQASPKAAIKVGRGLTTPIIHIDEPPFQPNINLAMGSAIGAMGAACERAEEIGEPTGIILTTTAGKKDDPSGKYVYNYLSEATIWSERFYDAKNYDDLKLIVRKNNRKGTYRIYAAFSHRQLGKTDSWLKDNLDRTSQTPDEANRDFFNVWTSGTETSPLPTATLEKITNSIIPELYQQMWSTGGYILRWYITENAIPNYLKTARYVIGIDTSDAVGGDDISFVMTDVETGGTVAIGTFNETNLIMFAQWLVTILETFENATMIIERRSSAATIIDYLLMFLPQRGIDPFQKLFNWVINDPLEHKQLYDEAMLPMRKRSEDIYIRAKKYFGFATSGVGQTSRTSLYSTTLINACRRSAEKIKDRSLVDQITGLVIKNGRVDHQDGGHDDLVIGYLLSHWLLTMGKNLLHYGINPKSIFIEQRVIAEVKPEDFYFIQEQQRIRNQIENVYERLVIESDPFISQRLEKELRFLDSKIILEDGEVFSVDAIINDLNQKKQTAKQTRRINSSAGYCGYIN